MYEIIKEAYETVLVLIGNCGDLEKLKREYIYENSRKWNAGPRTLGKFL